MDYTQNFIDEVKGCLEPDPVTDSELDVELATYSPKACPIQAMPASTATITLTPTSVFPRTYMTEYLPFNINNSSRENDGENLRNTIIGSLRNFFDVNTLRNMYTHILTQNELLTSEIEQKLQSNDLIELLYEFVKIEARSTDSVGYCSSYILQRLPKAAGDDNPLALNFKLSWLGSDAKMYYTIITITADTRPAYFANTIEATEIVAEGLNPSKMVYISIDDEMLMEPSSIAAYVQENTQAVFEAAYETFGLTDALEFARQIKEFDVVFTYNSIEGGSYGITSTCNVHFTQRSMYLDKQDQWLPWPMVYDFAYRGELADENYTRLMEITYVHEQQDAITSNKSYDCRIGYSSDITWE